MVMERVMGIAVAVTKGVERAASGMVGKAQMEDLVAWGRGVPVAMGAVANRAKEATEGKEGPGALAVAKAAMVEMRGRGA
jgi:hypothetical protein